MEFRLRQLRKARRLSPLALAIELGMAQNSISRFETGERRPDYDTLIEIAEYFNVSLDYLTGRTDKPALNK